MGYLFPELEKGRCIDYRTGQIYFWPREDLSEERTSPEEKRTQVYQDPNQLDIFSRERQNDLFN